MFNSSREGTNTMRKKSAAQWVPLAYHFNLRRFGNNDAGAEEQDSTSKQRGLMASMSSGTVIECTRDVYLKRVCHILSSRGSCNACVNELSRKSTII